MRKKLFFCIIVLLIIISFTSSCFATSVYQDYNWYSQDPTEFILTYYDNISYRFLYEMYKAKNSSSANSENLQQFINRVKSQEPFYISSQNRNGVYHVYFYNEVPDDFRDTSLSLFFNNGYVNCPTTIGTVSTTAHYAAWVDNNGNFRFTAENTTPDIQIPQCLIYRTSEIVKNYISILDGTSTSDIASMLVVITSKIDESNQKLGEIKNSIDETNNFLKSEDDSGVNYNVSKPSVDSSNVDGAFNGIFTMFYNSMTGDAIQFLDFPIPFTNQYIRIPSNLLSNFVNSLSPSTGNINFYALDLQYLLQNIWYFLVGLYIIKDIHNIIQDLKSGDILTKTDTDVKADML